MGCLKLPYRENKSPLKVVHNRLKVNEKGSAGNYRYGYQGEFSEEDEETGYNAFQLRLYDPIVSRWISPDPMREFASPYVAMGNNPINLTDPTGGCTDCPPTFTVVGGGDYIDNSNPDFMSVVNFDAYYGFTKDPNKSWVENEQARFGLLFDGDLMDFFTYYPDAIHIGTPGAGSAPTVLKGISLVLNGSSKAGSVTAAGLNVLVKTKDGMWKWAVNGRVASQQTLNRVGLAKPALSTTNKASAAAKGFEEAILGVKAASEPMSKWQAFKHAIATVFGNLPI